MRLYPPQQHATSQFPEIRRQCLEITSFIRTRSGVSRHGSSERTYALPTAGTLPYFLWPSLGTLIGKTMKNDTSANKAHTLKVSLKAAS